jgi:hypothetical protein
MIAQIRYTRPDDGREHGKGKLEKGSGLPDKIVEMENHIAKRNPMMTVSQMLDYLQNTHHVPPPPFTSRSSYLIDSVLLHDSTSSSKGLILPPSKRSLNRYN